MIFVILAVVFTGISWWNEFMYGYKSFSDWVSFIGMTFLGGLAGVAISLIASLIISCSPAEVDYTLIDTQPIYALQDNVTHGSPYYIGSGVKDGDAAYFYVTEDDWGMKINSKDTDYSYVIYDNDEEPRVEIYDGEWANPVIKILGFIGPENRYKFYVPEGTMTADINIDLQ